MTLRAAAFAILTACVTIHSAIAQAPPATTQSAPAPEAVAAARDFFQAFLFDSGMVAQMITAVAEQRMPEVRRTFLDSPAARSTTPARREALTSFVESLPRIMDREFTAEMVIVADNAAQRFASHMTAQEMTEATAFLRSEAGHLMVQELTNSVIASRSAGLSTTPDSAALTAFEATPAGQAFAREEDALSRIIDEELALATRRIVPRIQLIVLNGVCGALEDDCPRQMRDALNSSQPT